MAELKLKRIENNKLNASVDCFIIPNRPSRFLEGFDYEDETAPDYMNLRDENIERIANLNNIEIQKGEKLVQVWLTSPDDLGSTNLNDHGFEAIKDGEIVRLHFICHLLPETILRGKNEGSTFDLKVKCFDIDKNEYELTMNVRCIQTEYRYSRFGRFEDVLACLTE